MSAWSHPICERDWIEREGDWKADGAVEVLTQVRRPVLMTEPALEQCCFCLQPTIFGAYVRHDPKLLRCGGDHPE